MGVAMNHKAKDKKYIEAGGLLLLLLLGIVGLPKNSQAQENRSDYWFEGGVGITIAGAGPETDSGGGYCRSVGSPLPNTTSCYFYAAYGYNRRGK